MDASSSGRASQDGETGHATGASPQSRTLVVAAFNSTDFLRHSSQVDPVPLVFVLHAPLCRAVENVAEVSSQPSPAALTSPLVH